MHVRIAIAGLAATCALVPLATPSGSQTVSTAEASVNSSHDGKSRASADDAAVRPFHVKVPEEQLVDLRRRLAARWPDQEAVAGPQGVQLATMKELVRYWQTGHDWRKAEAKLNTLPQFVTAIDGVDIHFIHVRSRHPNALPLIMTHGWPGGELALHPSCN